MAYSFLVVPPKNCLEPLFHCAWSISTTKHWFIHFNHLRCSSHSREVGDYDWTNDSVRFHRQRKKWLFLLMGLSIIEVQSGKLKYLNTVELTSILQGRRITALLNDIRDQFPILRSPGMISTMGLNKSMCDLNKYMITRFTKFMNVYICLYTPRSW